MNYDAGRIGADPLLIDDQHAAARRRRRLILLAVLALVVVAAVAWFAFGRGAAPKAGPRPEQVQPVTVVVPGRQAVGRTVSGTGTLAARRELPVGVAGEGGMVTRVLVEPGDWVGAGQVLALVDRSVQTQTAASLNAQIGVARSDLTLAQAELQRAQQLVGRGFISQADVQRRIAGRDAAAARLKVAQATASEQGARNRRLDIRAPAAGLVLTRGVEPGQIVSSASGVLFRLAKGGEMEMRAQLAENDLAGLHAGARAQVTPVGGTRAFAGEVWQLAPVIDQQTRQGVARIALRYDPALRPGGFAAATIVGAVNQQPELPQSAIQSDDKGNYVYIVGKDDRVERRYVKLGTVDDRDVAITDGLTGQERVVLSAGAFLNPGQKIKPIAGKRNG